MKLITLISLFCLPALLLFSTAFFTVPEMVTVEGRDDPAPEQPVTVTVPPIIKCEKPIAEKPRELHLIELAAGRGAFIWFGLSERAAVTKAFEQGLSFRVVEKDGKPLPITRDFQKGRLNVHLLHGLVVYMHIEGTSESEGTRNLELLPYLGLSVEQATALAKSVEVPMRVTVRDGKGLPVTADMILDRVNLVIRAGMVCAVGNG